MICKTRVLDALHDIEDYFNIFTRIILYNLHMTVMPVPDEVPSVYEDSRTSSYLYQRH